MTADGGLSTIKSLVIRAWRERWTDVQFSIHLKQIVPVESQITALPDILIQQAMSGSAPNSLILSYLNHLSATQVLSSSCVLKSVLQFEDITRPHCIISLVDFAKALIKRIRPMYGPDSCLSHACTLLHTVLWLLQTLLKSLQKQAESKSSATPFLSVIESVQACFEVTIVTGVNKSLMLVAKKENTELFSKVEQAETDVRAVCGQIQNTAIRDKVEACLKLSAMLHQESQSDLSILNQPHIPSVAGLIIGFEAVMNPLGEINPFVDQLLLLEKLQHISRVDLYCDIVRVCCIGLIDCADDPDELKWAAFTFLKLPAVLKHIFHLSPGHNNGDELDQGINKLLNYASLLDLTEMKSNCDIILQLTELFEKMGLLSKTQCAKLSERRASESRKPKTNETSGGQPNASLILKAEPTVSSLLKTLDTDYGRNQDALLGVLSHMLSGKSFELILVAAATTHKLQNFAVKLVKFNEFAKQAAGETGRAPSTRALLFDISFLMLCHMTQTYGIEVITENVESRDSFFAQWSIKYLGDPATSPPDIMSSGVDQAKVDSLLEQVASGGQWKTAMTRWHDVCMNLPFVIQEVVNAAECGAISSDSLKIIMDHVKSRLCSLPVVAVGWLCTYLNTVSEANRQIPLNMIHQLMVPLQGDTGNTHYAERSHLMNVVLKKMTQTVESSWSTAKPVTDPQFLSENLQSMFKSAYSKTWVDLKGTRLMEQVLSVAGPDWLCYNVIREMLKFSRIEDLSRSLSLVLSVLHLDLVTLVLSLLRHVIPLLIQQPIKSQLLVDPRGYFLAKLCVAAIACVLVHRKWEKDQKPSVKCRRKRTRVEYEVEETETDQPSKVRKLQPTEEVSFHSEGFNMDLLSASAGVDQVPKYDTHDPLNRAMAGLFRLFDAIVDVKTTSHVTCFVMNFMKEAIKAGPDTSGYILQFVMPSYSLISKLSRKMPDSFTEGEVLKLCDTSVQGGRKAAVKILCDIQRMNALHS